MSDNAALICAMMEYDAGDPARIQHFLKVYAFAQAIGQSEGLAEEALQVLAVAALVHDIGIRPSEAKYGRCDGSLQEQEGPPAARKLLAGLGYAPELVSRVCFLVGHHHTYQDIDGPDYQILLEADFLVNAYEGGMDQEAVRRMRDKLFRTQTGIRMLAWQFDLESKDAQ